MERCNNQKKRRRVPASFTSMTVDERVEWLLAIRSITQIEAGELTGISQATISNIFGSAARRPSAETLPRMAKVLECDPHFILSGN